MSVIAVLASLAFLLAALYRVNELSPLCPRLHKVTASGFLLLWLSVWKLLVDVPIEKFGNWGMPTIITVCIISVYFLMHRRAWRWTVNG